MASRIVGLDIGKDTIRAVEVENADKARPVVVKYGQIAVPEGAVRSGEVREVHTVAAAIRRLWSNEGFKSKDIVLGIGNQRVLARDLVVPKMPLPQIRESLPFQVQELLPVPVADALLDFYPISEDMGESGPVVHGLLVAAIKDSVMANIEAVRQAGLSASQVDLIPFALTRVLARGTLARANVVLIDIGASTTSVIVSFAGVPQFVRMIPAGGDDVTLALVNHLELSYQQAELAKRTRGYSSAPVASESERRVAEIIHTSTGELLNSLRNTINYFTNARQNEPIAAIVLSGGGAQLNGLPHALSEMTRMQVIAADPFSTVDASRKIRTAGDDTRSMTVALGLALGSVA